MPTLLIASGTSTSSSIDLGPVMFDRVYVDNRATLVITMWGSEDDSTYLPVYRNNSSVAGATFVSEAVGTAYSGFWVPLAVGHRYIKFTASATLADGGSVKVSTVYK
jgi:hypothetical protein